MADASQQQQRAAAAAARFNVKMDVFMTELDAAFGGEDSRLKLAHSTYKAAITNSADPARVGFGRVQFLEQVTPHIGHIITRNMAEVDRILPTLEVVQPFMIAKHWDTVSPEMKESVLCHMQDLWETAYIPVYEDTGAAGAGGAGGGMDIGAMMATPGFKEAAVALASGTMPDMGSLMQGMGVEATPDQLAAADGAMRQMMSSGAIGPAPAEAADSVKVDEVD